MQDITSATVRTMTSREIAELVEARHNDVVATIERLFSKGLLRSSRETRRESTGGRPLDVYDLIERDTHLVVSGYSDEHRARVIDRWEALESGAAVPIAAAAPKLLPIDLLEQAQALKTLLGDDELKRLAPLLWQEIADGAQNAMRRAGRPAGAACAGRPEAAGCGRDRQGRRHRSAAEPARRRGQVRQGPRGAHRDRAHHCRQHPQVGRLLRPRRSG